MARAWTHGNRTLEVLKAVVYLWATGEEITQHAVREICGFNETKHIHPHMKKLVEIGVLKKVTLSHSHVIFLFGEKNDIPHPERPAR